MLQVRDFIDSMDTAAQAANEALHQAGGEVYVVEGAVRDLVLGKNPKDYDLLVTELTTPEVKKALQSIPGAQIGLVGASFGIFLVRMGNDACEVAQPRTERSTGSGHQDF